jgi:hypothetical protein
MSRKNTRDSGALVFGGVPRARLMPPEVALRRKEAGRRQGLVAATVAVVIMVGAGVAATYWVAAVSEARLAEERRTTDELLATQLGYAEVIQVQGQLASVENVRASLASVEVLWQPVLSPYLAVLSADEVVEDLSFRGDAPAEQPLGVSGPLRAPRVATITVVVATTTQPEPWRWYRAWEKLDTFGDASIDAIVLLEDVYETTVTINLNETALSQRFPADEETQ